MNNKEYKEKCNLYRFFLQPMIEALDKKTQEKFNLIPEKQKKSYEDLEFIRKYYCFKNEDVYLSMLNWGKSLDQRKISNYLSNPENWKQFKKRIKEISLEN